MRDIPVGVRVVCASAGNFGQAVAYAGRARGTPVQVFTATNANVAKVGRMRELGAEVIQTGDDFDSAKNAARAYAEGQVGHVFVEDGHEPRIAEGAGTIGVELAPLGVDTLLVPVGNGALVGGVARWMKAASPTTRVVAVGAAGAPAMAWSWRGEELVSCAEARTMADGIAVRVPVPVAVGWMRQYVDDVVPVDEDHIGAALRVARDTLGLLLEPAGAVGIAAAMQHVIEGDTLATILTGSNLSPELLTELSGGRAAVDESTVQM